ncbi:DNA polymerase IV [Aestuariimicrobium sp. T2.26MG-19.2B]|uniref:DNA polymerase IV n=1 Tax=Aestuariimicrobium sp. T2.26MG-19.2B TaxID=3040679 RepID=UPI0025425A86|nr:DNA polymerase IV [Aestuariimicrobium sp. T2.26MG-19.2B]
MALQPGKFGVVTMASETVIMHVDMDAFYATVELARRPELRGRPMWVGGAERGVVLSASYEARAAGVRSGMPSSRARRLCPQGIPVPPDHDTYAAVSKGVFAIFGGVTPRVEAISIDEAFLDVTGSVLRLGDPRVIAELIRAQVADEQQITCSVGIAPSKFVAKLASNQAKPDGVVQVPPSQVVAFLHPLPVEKVWGVGESTAARLHQLGLTTIGEVAHTSRQTLQRAMGTHAGGWLHDLSWGRDDRRVVGEAVERSIGAQETFSRDTDDPGLVTTELLRMAARTAGRMRQAQVLGRGVSISLRFADFTTITRTTQLATPTDVTDEIYAAALRCWRGLNLQRARIRRVGVRVERLVDADEAYQQFTLDAPDKGMREVEQAADAAIMRFGPHAVRRARLTG